MEELKNELVVFQTDSGALELRKDMDQDTVWANQADLAFCIIKINQLFQSIFEIFSRMKKWMKKAICKKCILLIQTNRLVFIL